MTNEEEFENIRLVVNSLRRDCQNTKSAKVAIKTVSERTGLDINEVKRIVIKLFKDKQ